MLTLANRDLSFPAAAGSHVSPEKRHQGARVVTKPAWKPSVRAWQFSSEACGLVQLLDFSLSVENVPLLVTCRISGLVNQLT